MADEKVSSSTVEKYDLVVFGATGFTGKYVVEEVARIADEEPGLTWAIAGRNMEKLQAVLEDVSKRTEKNLYQAAILIADVKSEQSLLDMCKQAKVVLNCVGPYRFYGDQVVRACIQEKANHIDISGEPQYLEKAQLLYNSKAKEAGVYIIGACGFDSIPADMGTLYTQRKFDGDLNSIEAYVKIHSGALGGGGHYATFESAVYGFAYSGELKDLRKQLYPTSPPRSNHKMIKRPTIFESKEASSFCVPFPGSDRSVVNRSQRYLYENKKLRPVQFNAYFCRESYFSAVLTIIAGVLFGMMASFSLGRTLLLKFPSLFSFGAFTREGPSQKQIDTNSFSMTFVGQGYAKKISDPEQQHEDAPDKKIVTKVMGPEAGYVSTPICMVQAAVVLLKEKNKLPESGGVFSPAAAFSETTLIERLDKHDVKFITVEEIKAK